ncbi:MAG TPA: DUF4157 domain-containing protein [Polyangia bacterium]
MSSYELLKRPISALPKPSEATKRPPPRALPPFSRLGGQPLPVPVRARMEEAFGTDFSGVRLHTGPEAARVARAHAARAVTEGENLAFADGQLVPGTPLGERRLAHELAHVVQQRRGGAAPSPFPGGALERDADRAAETVMAGRSPRVERASAPGPAREMITKNLSALSLQELQDELARVQKWLAEHSIVELDYAPTEQYLREIQSELERRASSAPGPVSYLDAFAAYEKAHPDKVAFTLPTFGSAPSGSSRHSEGVDWAKVADQLAHDDNPLGIPDPPRTAFEAKMRREGARRGFLPIWQTGFARPIGYRETDVGVTHYYDLDGNEVGMTEIPIESDIISPTDFIPFEAVGSLAASGVRTVGRALLSTALKYGAKETAVEGSEILGRLGASEALQAGAREAGGEGGNVASEALEHLKPPTAAGARKGPAPPDLAKLEQYADEAWRVVGGKGPRPGVAIKDLDPGVAGRYISETRTIEVANLAAREADFINTVWHEASHGRFRDVLVFMNEHLGHSLPRTLLRPLDEVVAYATGGFGQALKSPGFVDRLLGLAATFRAPFAARLSMATAAEKALWVPHAIAYLAALAYTAFRVAAAALPTGDRPRESTAPAAAPGR